MKNIIKYGLLLAVIGAGIGVYLWNKPHENMDRAKTDVQISAGELFTAFAENEAQANEIYLDKVIAVTGKVREVSKSPEGLVKVTLDSGDEMFGVICQLDELSEHQRTEFQPGESVMLKGKCTGMLMDVVLVRCVEVK
ncbi:OB-fold protein [Lewinella cohaerens]|uniref:OB-fold protein n=1 Tax=Lewinella cohaerens TaxID=70995 RepID=UPI0003705C7D|nr:hypothetical protein [Lewinella cohaerens]